MDFEFISICYFVFSLIILVISLFISLFSTFSKQSLRLDNKLLKHNIEECYKYIEQLEEEKRRNHYD